MMGKEARGVWGQLSDGESDGKLLWEPPKLIFRGAVRGIFQGHALRDLRVEGDDLVLTDGTRFTLEPGEAAKWLHAIQNPPGRLDKLGVKAGQTVVVAEPIVHGEGRVRVDDSSWPARGPDAPAGARVTVIEVVGSTLIVAYPAA